VFCFPDSLTTIGGRATEVDFPDELFFPVACRLRSGQRGWRTKAGSAASPRLRQRAATASYEHLLPAQVLAPRRIGTVLQLLLCDAGNESMCLNSSSATVKTSESRSTTCMLVFAPTRVSPFQMRSWARQPSTGHEFAATAPLGRSDPH